MSVNQVFSLDLIFKKQQTKPFVWQESEAGGQRGQTWPGYSGGVRAEGQPQELSISERNDWLQGRSTDLYKAVKQELFPTVQSFH